MVCDIFNNKLLFHIAVNSFICYCIYTITKEDAADENNSIYQSKRWGWKVCIV